jgi:hypothetical protein
MSLLNLWTSNAPPIPQQPTERRSSLTPKLMLDTYDSVNRVQTGFRSRRQGLSAQGHASAVWVKHVTERLPPCEQQLQALMDQLCLERRVGATAAIRRSAQVDMKWLAELRKVSSDSGESKLSHRWT